MFGKILGAIAGQQAAQHVSGVSGATGALMGAGSAALLRRLGPVGLIGAAVGGYFAKRYYDRHKAERSPAPAAAPVGGASAPRSGRKSAAG